MAWDSASGCLRQAPSSPRKAVQAWELGPMGWWVLQELAVSQGGTGICGTRGRGGRVKEPFPHLFCESLCPSKGDVALLSLSHHAVMGYCCVCVPVLPVFDTHNIC